MTSDETDEATSDEATSQSDGKSRARSMTSQAVSQAAGFPDWERQSSRATGAADMTTNDRWAIACHEASHAIAGLELGGQCDGIVLVAEESGAAFVDGLYSDKRAFMVASGPAGEALAESHEPPQCEFVRPETVAAEPTPGATREFATFCRFADLRESLHGSVSDSRQLAEWAISGVESEPERWAGRVRFAQKVADEIVQRNAETIVKVARELYRLGRLTGQQIESIHQKGTL